MPYISSTDHTSLPLNRNAPKPQSLRDRGLGLESLGLGYGGTLNAKPKLRAQYVTNQPTQRLQNPLIKEYPLHYDWVL